MVYKSYDSMVQKLSPMKLYKLDGVNNVTAEIATYAEFLDDIAREIAKICEGNIFTAKGKNTLNIKKYCKLFGLPQTLESSVLYDLIELRETKNKFTKYGIVEMLSAFGFTAQLSENFTTNVLTVTISADIGLYRKIYEKEAIIRSCLPTNALQNAQIIFL